MELEVRVFGVWFFMTLGRFEEVSSYEMVPIPLMQRLAESV